jgi:hypothetical protein
MKSENSLLCEWLILSTAIPHCRDKMVLLVTRGPFGLSVSNFEVKIAVLGFLKGVKKNFRIRCKQKPFFQ